jgi:hypothetical protein
MCRGSTGGFGWDRVWLLEHNKADPRSIDSTDIGLSRRVYNGKSSVCRFATTKGSNACNRNVASLDRIAGQCSATVRWSDTQTHRTLRAIRQSSRVRLRRAQGRLRRIRFGRCARGHVRPDRHCEFTSNRQGKRISYSQRRSSSPPHVITLDVFSFRSVTVSVQPPSTRITRNAPIKMCKGLFSGLACIDDRMAAARAEKYPVCHGEGQDSGG